MSRQDSPWPDELAWRAWRYVCQELTPEDRTAFEQRLADDVAACDALADATRLHSTLVAARGPYPVPSNAASTVTRHSRGHWLVVACAACLLYLMAWGMQSFETLNENGRSAISTATRNRDFGPDHSANADEAELVVDVWMSLNHEVDAEPALVVDADSLDELTDEVVADVPDWMFAALELDDISDAEEDSL